MKTHHFTHFFKNTELRLALNNKIRCLTGSVIPLADFPKPWPCFQPMPSKSFLPLFFSAIGLVNEGEKWGGREEGRGGRKGGEGEKEEEKGGRKKGKGDGREGEDN